MNLKPHERYIFKPFIGSSHLWAANHFKKLGAHSRVLDIGAGSGVMSSILKQGGIEDVYAVEIDPDTREHLAPLYKEVQEKIEAFEGQKFDLILLLDVLEHMAEPIPFLKKCVGFLSEKGVILISVPNIAHWSVRLPLLFGEFNYTERGLLDKTHLQFFTRKSLRNSLSSLDQVEVEEISSSIEPAELVLPKLIWNNSAFRCLSSFRVSLAKLLPGLMAYQHLAALRHNKATKKT